MYRRTTLLLSAWLGIGWGLLLPGAAAADQYLAYVGGGLERIGEGGWSERRGQLIFKQVNGTLVSAPARDVDLAASTFITWQLNGRRRVPYQAAVTEPASDAETPAPCAEARVLEVRDPETLEIVTRSSREVVHLACLDAPETEHPSPQIAWFGRATLGWMRLELKAGEKLCVSDQAPERIDAEGHRTVFVTLADGRDLSATVIGGGYGLLRPGACDRAAEYRELENRAIEEGRGLWGARSERSAVAAVSNFGAASAGPPPPRQRIGGG